MKRKYRYIITSDYETLFDYRIEIEYMGKIHRCIFQNLQEWQNFEKKHAYINSQGERFIKNITKFFQDLKNKETKKCSNPQMN